MRGLCRQVMGECVMKKMDKRLLVGVVPTRREAFENETTTRQKEEVMKRFRQLSKELDFDMVDIEDINEEGLLMTYRDVKAAYTKLSAAGVDALIFPHCNFGQEEAVGRLAKDMGVPVLIWGPRAERAGMAAHGRPVRDVRHHEAADALRGEVFLY